METPKFQYTPGAKVASVPADMVPAAMQVPTPFWGNIPGQLASTLWCITAPLTNGGKIGIAFMAARAANGSMSAFYVPMSSAHARHMAEQLLQMSDMIDDAMLAAAQKPVAKPEGGAA